VILAESDIFWLVDLGSTNGTFIGKTQLLKERFYQLTNMNELTFGQVKAVFKDNFISQNATESHVENKDDRLVSSPKSLLEEKPLNNSDFPPEVKDSCIHDALENSTLEDLPPPPFAKQVNITRQEDSLNNETLDDLLPPPVNEEMNASGEPMEENHKLLVPDTFDSTSKDEDHNNDYLIADSQRVSTVENVEEKITKQNVTQDYFEMDLGIQISASKPRRKRKSDLKNEAEEKSLNDKKLRLKESVSKNVDHIIKPGIIDEELSVLVDREKQLTKSSDNHEGENSVGQKKKGPKRIKNNPEDSNKTPESAIKSFATSPFKDETKGMEKFSSKVLSLKKESVEIKNDESLAKR
jgi:pSer/pThr/pTyr-binding forkhead associated (FHA) protein